VQQHDQSQHVLAKENAIVQYQSQNYYHSTSMYHYSGLQKMLGNKLTPDRLNYAYLL